MKYISKANKFDDNDYIQYIGLDPEDIDSQIELSRCYFYTNNLLDANTHIDQVIENFPGSYEVKSLKGTLLEYLDTSENVEKYYNQLKEDFHGKIEIWLSLGIYYYNTSSYNQALEEFKKSLERFPTDTANHLWISSTYSHLGNFTEAENYAEKAIELIPCANNYNNLGNILVDQTKYAEAIFHYDAAVETADYLDENFLFNSLTKEDDYLNAIPIN